MLSRLVQNIRYSKKATYALSSRAFSQYVPFNSNPRVSILAEIGDNPGDLHDLLKWFWKDDINVTHIESRPTPRGSEFFQMHIDFEGSIGDGGKTDRLMQNLQNECKSMFILDEKEVPWFPRDREDLDKIANRILDAGTDLDADHPGFTDQVYRERRAELAQIALDHRNGAKLPHIKYTPEEIETWGIVMSRLEGLHDQYACSKFKEIWPLLKKHCGYAYDNIPQVDDISRFLTQQTGFKLRPCAGLLSSRDFLNGLAFRVFFSTQYLRHSSVPLYTPEPDICHEFLGHVPMFADPDFADLSQEVGLASLGASDADIERLARCYWYTVEFGLVREGGAVKAYGAGLLSSFGEMEYACSSERPAGGTDERPNLEPWEPNKAAELEFPITTYQPTYFVAESLNDAKSKLRSFCEELQRPFHARYNALSGGIWIDRAVRPAELDPPTKAYA